MQPPVSVLVISFNRKEDLRLSLEALYATGYPGLEVIVVDNASRDGSREMFASFPDLKLILNEDNKGFAEANDQGLALATGEYIALINDDAVVAPDYFERMVAFMEAHPECAAAGGKAYFWNEDQPLGSRNNAYYAYSVVDPETGSSRAFTSTPDAVREVGTLSGCAVLISKRAIEAVGGAFLEPLFFTYYEETDFFARAIRKGWKLYYTGEPAVWHRVRASTAANPYHYHFHMQRNRILYGYRNFEGPQLRDLESGLGRAFRRKFQLRPWRYFFPGKVERRALRDALVWWRANRELLVRHRQLASGGAVPYNQALRAINARAEADA